MIDAGPAILVLLAWWLIAKAAYAWAGRRRPGPHDACRCGHGRTWHTHFHASTYCAACLCDAFQIGNHGQEPRR